MYLSLVRTHLRVAASVLAACLVVLVGVDVTSAEAITPSDVLATSAWPSTPTENLINGLGLSGVGDLLSQTHGNDGGAAGMWHGGTNEAGLGPGFTGNPPVVNDQALVFVMPGLVDIDSTHIWNHNQSGLTARGVNEFEFLVSSDTDPLTASYTSLGLFNLAAASGTPEETAQVINLGTTASDVRLVKFDINSTHSGSASEYVGLSEVRFEGEILTSTNPTLQIDRDDGQIMLLNDTFGPINFYAYQINSDAVGALDASGWTSVAQNYDAGSPGPNQVDPTDHWIEFTPAPFFGVLGEGELSGGDGVTLGVGESIDLGTAWIKNPTDDIEILLQQADGSFLPVDVTYVGDEIVPGDLNFNGTVDPPDWPLFRAGLGGVHSALTAAQSYALGDLDGDGDTDVVDFRQFEALYDTANGAGSLAALMAVPEPSTIGLTLVVAGLVFFGTAASNWRRRQWILLTAFACVFSSSRGAQAQNNIDFTHIEIVDFATPYSVDYDISNIVTNNENFPVTTNGFGYASQGLGANTFVDFMFDQSYTFTNITLIDRLHSGAAPNTLGGVLDYVTAFDLILSGNSIFGDGDDTVVSVGPFTPPTAPISVATATHAVTISDVVAQYVRYDITGTGGANSGAHTLQFETSDVVPPAGLFLQVDKMSGDVTLMNTSPLGDPVSINAYQIESPAGALDLSGWTSLGDLPAHPAGDGSGNGWEQGTGSNSELLAEAFLLGSSPIGLGDILPLGQGYDTSNGAEDVVFRYSVEGGDFVKGVVQYVSAGDLFGDYNGDGIVNAADYALWRDRVGAESLPHNEDPTASPGVVDGEDYAVWHSNFGGGTGTGSLTGSTRAVPEPATWILVLALATFAVFSKRCFVLHRLVPRCVLGLSVALTILSIVSARTQAGTPDAIYLFGDNSDFTTENGAPGVGVGQAFGADVADATLDHAGDSTFAVLQTYRDLVVNTAIPSSRPSYVDTAALNYPGTSLGATTSGIGVRFDGVDDTLGDALGLGFPQQGDDAFTGDFENAYSQILTRVIDGWVRPTNPNSGSRQDIVNDTYQFGIHITDSGTWGMNFGSTAGVVDTFNFDSGVSVASTLDSNGWAHVQQRTFGSGSAALYVNGEIVLLTAVGAPFYHPLAAGATDSDLELSFGSNLPGDGNFFGGELDNFRLIIAGDNSDLTANGMNYGAVDLSVDNDYITANVVPGDANGDGLVNGDGTGLESVDDVAFFVNHFFDRHLVTDLNGVERQIGDLTSVTTMADFNGDGMTDIRDWYILTQNHEDASLAANLDLGALLSDGAAVPEPGSLALAAFCLAVMIFCRGFRRSIT